MAGLGLGFAYTRSMSGWAMSDRIGFGFVVGLVAFAGVNLLRDGINAILGRGRVESWRVYFVQGLLGGFIGAGLGFYLDATQVAVVVAKFHRYLGAGSSPSPSATIRCSANGDSLTWGRSTAA